jgi:thioredoxin reductase
MRTIAADIAIVGAGPAGLSAAYQAASAGADVLVIDENKLPGGQLFKQIHKFFGSGEHKAGVRGYEIGRQLLEMVEGSGAKVLMDSLVYGIMPDKSMGILSGGVNYSVEAKKIILACGAKENAMAFPGCTLPGVMGAGAAQTMANVNRVLPGKRILMVGSGNVGLIVSYQLMQAGAQVLAVVEGAPVIGGYGVHAGKIRRAGVPIYVRHTLVRVWGDGEVEHAEIAEIDDKWRPVPGTEKTYDVDAVCLAVGLNPMTELAWMCGCEFAYIPALGGHVPLHDGGMETTVEGVYVAGDVTGVEEASSAIEEGNLAGVSAAEALGFLSSAAAEAKRAEIAGRLQALRSGMFGEKRRTAKEKQLAAMEVRHGR